MFIRKLRPYNSEYYEVFMFTFRRHAYHNDSHVTCSGQSRIKQMTELFIPPLPIPITIPSPTFPCHPLIILIYPSLPSSATEQRPLPFPSLPFPCASRNKTFPSTAWQSDALPAFSYTTWGALYMAPCEDYSNGLTLPLDLGPEAARYTRCSLRKS